MLYYLGAPPLGRQLIAIEATHLQKARFPTHLIELLLWVSGPTFPKSFRAVVAWYLLLADPLRLGVALTARLRGSFFPPYT